MSLYKKISQVMQDVEYLQKDDSVSTGKTGSYKAISEEKVTETVRKSLIKNGLVILPVSQEHLRHDTILTSTYNGEQKESISRLSTVNTVYKIVDIDTGESELLASSGTGVDTQDKGVGKAMTYAYKYMLLRAFAIPTGEDPDKVSSQELDEKQNKGYSSEKKMLQEKIGDIKAKVLEGMIADKGGNLDKTLKFYKVKALTDLTVEQAGHLQEQLLTK